MTEYCQWESFNASCSSPTNDQVILIKSARYGRMRFGRCVREDHGSLGCYADVMSQLSSRCSGRRSCSVHVPDPSLHDAQSCPKELMPYLEASYVCVRGSGYNLVRLCFWKFSIDRFQPSCDLVTLSHCRLIFLS